MAITRPAAPRRSGARGTTGPAGPSSPLASVPAETTAATPTWAQPADRTPRLRRSPRLIAIGLLCACLGGLGAAFAWTNLSTAQTVIVAERPIARGAVIAPGDLGLTDVSSAPGVAIMAGESLAGLVGQQALVDLPLGSLIGPESIGHLSVPAGDAVIGLRLAPGRSPVGELPYGTLVTLLRVGEAGRAPAWTVQASVVTPAVIGSDGSVLVDVALPQGEALVATTLSALGELALMRLGG